LIDSNGRTIWIAAAHRNDEKRFAVRVDEKLTAFMELEAATGARDELVDKQARFFPNPASLNGSESDGGGFPYVLPPPPDLQSPNQHSWWKKLVAAIRIRKLNAIEI